MWHRPGASNLGKVRFATDAPKLRAALTPPPYEPRRKASLGAAGAPPFSPQHSCALSLSPSSSLSHPPSSFCSPAPRSFSIPTEERGLLCPDEGEKKKSQVQILFQRERECTWWQAFYVANSYLFIFSKDADHSKNCCFVYNKNLNVPLAQKVKLQTDGNRSYLMLSLALKKFSPSPKEIGRSDVSERECKSIEVAMEVAFSFFFLFFYIIRHVHDHPGATTPTRQTPTKPQAKRLQGSQWEQDIQVQNEIRQLILTGELGGHAPFSGCWSWIKLHTHPVSPAYQPNGFLAERIRAFAG